MFMTPQWSLHFVWWIKRIFGLSWEMFYEKKKPFSFPFLLSICSRRNILCQFIFKFSTETKLTFSSIVYTLLCILICFNSFIGKETRKEHFFWIFFVKSNLLFFVLIFILGWNFYFEKFSKKFCRMPVNCKIIFWWWMSNEIFTRTLYCHGRLNRHFIDFY